MINNRQTWFAEFRFTVPKASLASTNVPLTMLLLFDAKDYYGVFK